MGPADSPGGSTVACLVSKDSEACFDADVDDSDGGFVRDDSEVCGASSLMNSGLLFRLLLRLLLFLRLLLVSESKESCESGASGVSEDSDVGFASSRKESALTSPARLL